MDYTVFGMYGMDFNINPLFLLLWPPEHEYVWLWQMEHVVDPSHALLDPEVPPLCLCQQMVLGHLPSHGGGQTDVAVFVHGVGVLVRVADLVGR